MQAMLKDMPLEQYLRKLKYRLAKKLDFEGTQLRTILPQCVELFYVLCMGTENTVPEEHFVALEEVMAKTKGTPQALSYKRMLSEEGAQAHFVRAMLLVRLRAEGYEGPLEEDMCANFFCMIAGEKSTVTMLDFHMIDEICAQSRATMSEPLEYCQLVTEDAEVRLVRAVLFHTLEPVSDETKEQLLGMMNADLAARDAAMEESDGDLEGDSLFMFLTQHLQHLQSVEPSKRDALLRGLLEIYPLAQARVKRKFDAPSPGELPPEIAYSAMKPLGQEISHRAGLLINLFPPQRVVWGAYVDLSKVVRTLRAKNYVKRVKYKTREDIWYRED